MVGADDWSSGCRGSTAGRSRGPPMVVARRSGKEEEHRTTARGGQGGDLRWVVPTRSDGEEEAELACEGPGGDGMGNRASLAPKKQPPLAFFWSQARGGRWLLGSWLRALKRQPNSLKMALWSLAGS
jgi:hypothetical protein